MTSPTEIFVNQSLGSVGIGGTNAPAAGTQQTWQVIVTDPFPPALLTAGTAFHVADVAAPGETIQVLNVALITGTTYLFVVVRGADGTTPVTHAAGFQIANVISSGFLSSLLVTSPLSQQVLATQRSGALTPWYAGLSNRLNARCDVACLGDSITEGQHGVGPPGTGFQNRWTARLADQLRARYPTEGYQGGGRGFIGVVGTGETSFVWPTTVAGSPTIASTLGPKGSFAQLTGAGQSITWSLVGDACDIMWCQVFGGGSFSYSVDGGSPVTVSTSGTTLDGQLTRVSLGSPGAHTLVVAWASGSADIDGVIEYYGDAGQGIQVHDCGHFGWQTSNWVTALNAGAGAGSAAGIAGGLSPSAVVITLGVNDQFNAVAPATFQANLQTIISDLEAQLPLPLPSFILQMLPPRVGQSGYTFPWSQYVAAAYAVAAADTSGPAGQSLVTVMDWTLGPRMPGADTDSYGFWQAADAVHPSNLGHQAIADGLLEFLMWR